MVPIIEINSLSYFYPDGTPALADINLQVFEGEKIALVGANGAGKSTLLLHLNGIFTGNGKITIAGLGLEKKNLPRIRALVGLIFQDPEDQLFSPTVFEDVAYGPIYQGFGEVEVRAKVQQALHAVELDDYSQRNSFHLSGGEKKRVAIATVVSMQPRILVIDEPTSGLDPRSRRELISLLQGLPQTMVIATHDLTMVKTLTPRTILLDRGKIIADGATDEILSDDHLLLIHGLR
jgi:cobalt/nickel transport system ATP-binding protein